ncbi:MAG: spermidine/putrescine ABC transporter substrate-binding protein [Gemmatimonadales bacterium]
MIQDLRRALLSGRLTRREFIVRASAAGLSLPAASALLAACGKGSPGDAPASGDLGPIEKDLNLYLWSDYLADDTIPNFEKEFGVRVTVDTYESNEEMAAKLMAGASGYDLVLPSSYLFPVLFANDLLAPLNRKYLTNWGNVAPLFLDPAWDPGNVHSSPWGWGTTGIAYRTDLIPAAPDSWAVFLDAAYSGKMTMLDDLRDVIGSFLRYRGHSLNSTDPAELAEAKRDAIAAKPHLKAYLSAPVKGQLIAGDVWLAQLWSGDAAQATAEKPEIAFVVPKEGSMIFVDALVVPRSAPHPRAAHEFINYVLRPEVAAAIADKTGYGTPNQAAAALTRTKVPYPTTEELARLEYQKDLGADAEAWDRLWTEIKAA